MTCDLQRANVWKRISAFLFDVILLAIACVLCAWGLSALLGFDAQYQTLMTRYQAAADACGLDMSIMTQTYSALTDAQRALVEQANAVLAADETAVHAYGMVIQLSILIVSFGVLSGYLLLEFLVPLLFKNGQTLGKKIFGVALMRNDGVRIGHVTLFVRTVLGKYAVETMIPIMAVMMLFFGNLLRESGVTTRLAKTASNALTDIVTILLGMTVGASTQASQFQTAQTIGIFALGFMAFVIASSSGVLFVKLFNLVLPKSKKINPLIGNAGVSAVPMSARISNNMGLKYDPSNYLLMHAMGPNVAGVIGSAVAAGVLLGFLA